MMEVYAATVAQSDHEIGRILDSLEASGQFDNTLVIYLEGDNGASAEGTMQGTTSEGPRVAGVTGVPGLDDRRTWQR